MSTQTWTTDRRIPQTLTPNGMEERRSRLAVILLAAALIVALALTGISATAWLVTRGDLREARQGLSEARDATAAVQTELEATAGRASQLDQAVAQADRLLVQGRECVRSFLRGFVTLNAGLIQSARTECRVLYTYEAGSVIPE